MSAKWVIGSAFLVAVQVFLLAMWPSPFIAANAVFTALMFLVTFVCWRGANR